MRSSLALFVTILTAFLVACRPGHDPGDRGELDVYGGATPDSTDVGALGGVQRDLIRALADPQGDPTPLMSREFALIDHADTAAVNRRGLDGRGLPGHGFIRTLATRLPIEYGEISTMEAYMARAGSAVMYVRHPSGERSITYWKHAEGSWIATVLLINVDERSFAEGRRRRVVGF